MFVAWRLCPLRAASRAPELKEKNPLELPNFATRKEIRWRRFLTRRLRRKSAPTSHVQSGTSQPPAPPCGMCLLATALESMLLGVSNLNGLVGMQLSLVPSSGKAITVEA